MKLLFSMEGTLASHFRSFLILWIFFFNLLASLLAAACQLSVVHLISETQMSVQNDTNPVQEGCLRTSGLCPGYNKPDLAGWCVKFNFKCQRYLKWSYWCVFLPPAVGGWRPGLHISSESPGEAYSCRSQTGLGHRAGPVCLSAGETMSAGRLFSMKLNILSFKVAWTRRCTPCISVFTLLSLSLQFPELHAMIMRRFSSKGDVDRAWQYVLQVRQIQYIVKNGIDTSLGVVS